MVSPCFTMCVRMPLGSAAAVAVIGWVAGFVTTCSVRSGVAGAGGDALASVFASVFESACVFAACNAGGCGALLIIGTVPLLSARVHLSVSSPPALAKGSVGLVDGSADFFS